MFVLDHFYSFYIMIFNQISDKELNVQLRVRQLLLVPTVRPSVDMGFKPGVRQSADISLV